MSRPDGRRRNGRRGSRWRVVAIGAGVLLVAAQFVPVARTNPPVESTVTAPPAVQEILVAACFDCHSHETSWPWYARIAPVSWWLADHVAEGRGELNFSRWPAYDFGAQDLLLREIAEEVGEGRMPPRSYTLAHPAARLTSEQRALIVDWAHVPDDDGESGSSAAKGT